MKVLVSGGWIVCLCVCECVCVCVCMCLYVFPNKSYRTVGCWQCVCETLMES